MAERSLCDVVSGDWKSALESLTTLKGVGAATASAVLAAGIPDVPFMSDELLMVRADVSCTTATPFTFAMFLLNSTCHNLPLSIIKSILHVTFRKSAP
jgi:hypothetical protein